MYVKEYSLGSKVLFNKDVPSKYSTPAEVNQLCNKMWGHGPQRFHE